MDTLFLWQLGRLQDALQRAIGRDYLTCPRIAGGAVRNAVTNHTVRDLDIFIQDVGDVAVLNDAFSWHLIPQYDTDEDYDGLLSSKDFFGVYKGWHTGFDLEIDVIHVSNVHDWVENHFPDHLSEMFIKADGSMGMTQRAREDYAEKKITYYPDRMTEKRLARLKELYPDWRYTPLNGVEVTTSGPRRRIPDLPPEVWNTRPFNAASAWEATMALCKGS